MYLAQYNATSSAINNYIEVELIEKNQRFFADMFSACYRDKVILNSSYEDEQWILTDRSGKQRIYFDRIEKSPKGYTNESFGQCLKRFVLCRLRNGSHYKSVCDSVNRIIEIGNSSNGFSSALGTIPGDVAFALDNLMSELDVDVPFYDVEEGARNGSRRRRLQAEEEYYRFEGRLNEMWSVFSDEERVVFFPLYFFWNLCNIIPTRPKEYSLIPYDCLQELNGQYYLSLPKSNIKGTDRKSNNNADSYPLTAFQVPAGMANKIIWYKENCCGFLFDGPKARRRLFNNIARNEFFHIRSERIDFQAKDITFLLDKFYVSYSQSHPEFHIENMMKWKPGDLRHLALINMIELGIDPAVCMYFAGHSDMTMCLHYAGNINSLTKLRIHQPQRYSVSQPKEKESIMVLNKAWKKLPGGYCKNDYGRGNNWVCANYPNDLGCPYFVGDGTLTKVESFRVELWQNFCTLCMQNEYKRAKKVLIEFQRQTAVYEGLING